MYAAFCRPSVLPHKIEKQTTRPLVTFNLLLQKIQKACLCVFCLQVHVFSFCLKFRKREKNSHVNIQELSRRAQTWIHYSKVTNWFLQKRWDLICIQKLLLLATSNIPWWMSPNMHTQMHTYLGNQLSSSLHLFTHTQWNKEKQRHKQIKLEMYSWLYNNTKYTK